MQEARKLSDDSFRMGPATLYTTVQRLAGPGLIEEVPAAKMPTAGGATTGSPGAGARCWTPNWSAWRRWCAKPKP